MPEHFLSQKQSIFLRNLSRLDEIEIPCSKRCNRHPKTNLKFFIVSDSRLLSICSINSINSIHPFDRLILQGDHLYEEKSWKLSFQLGTVVRIYTDECLTILLGKFERVVKSSFLVWIFASKGSSATGRRYRYWIHTSILVPIWDVDIGILYA